MMLPDAVPELQTTRFALRILSTKDVPEFLHYVDTEPELWRFALVACNDHASIISYVEEALTGLERGTSLPFVVIDRATGKIVGSTRFYDFSYQSGCTSLGYTWYSRHYQGTGINTHCKFLLLEYAFEQLALERVELRADLRNARSIAAMKKIGFTQEGILRSHLPVADGTRRDSIVFSMLKQEWEERKIALKDLIDVQL